MRVLIAPDSFKESASARDVASAIAKGLSRAWPDAEFDLAPMADGGEGTMDVLVEATQGRYVSCTARDPLSREIQCRYGILGDDSTAVIEMAAASGLPLVEENERDPAITCTYGTGQLIRHALHSGYRHIIVGMGGSATNDGGAGMARALGYKFLDADNRPLSPGGLELRRLATIDSTEAEPLIDDAVMEAAYDVDVPLYGATSTSMMFAFQKGADATLCRNLDKGLQHFAKVLNEQLHMDVAGLAGAGAAGGLGAGLAAFCGATLTPGVDLIAHTIDLKKRIRDADLVITGEGKLDNQTKHGKVPAGVASMARQFKKPIVAFAGVVDSGARSELDQLFDEIAHLCERDEDIPDAMSRTAHLLAEKAYSFALDWDSMINSRGE